MPEWILKTDSPDRWRYFRLAAYLVGAAAVVGVVMMAR